MYIFLWSFPTIRWKLLLPELRIWFLFYSHFLKGWVLEESFRENQGSRDTPSLRIEGTGLDEDQLLWPLAPSTMKRAAQEALS